ncbi:MAG TPA: rhodanese-like domain-containing protein [Candidatus Hydrogenedentes bacterium]|nr:rhodanese-like domain-containing protein [Candidatus Hydrogenedentota bacterium]
MAIVQTISPTALKTLHDSNPNITVIDVRTPPEYREVHVPFARLVPLESFDAKALLADAATAGESTIYVFCQTGWRAKKAAEKIVALSQRNSAIVDGGVRAWEAACLPVVRGRKTVSLERQVRIAAGVLVTTGIVFGYLVHEIFFGLSAFVGAGLTFAGVTDTCGMGLLLARMPWNQANEN